jgi:hypothetical protein
MTCAGDMVDSKIMAFIGQTAEGSEVCDLFITPKDFSRLWGQLTPCPASPQRQVVWCLQNGHWEFWFSVVVYTSLLNSSEKMHWQSVEAFDRQEGFPFVLNLKDKMIIGGSPLINLSQWWQWMDIQLDLPVLT